MSLDRHLFLIALAAAGMAAAASAQTRFDLAPSAPGFVGRSGAIPGMLVDFDSDGDLDVFGIRRYHEFDRSGRYLPHIDFTWTGGFDYARTRGVGDINGDGHLDAVLAGITIPQILPRVLFGDQNFQLTESMATHFPNTQAWIMTQSIQLIDLDRDSDLDAIGLDYNTGGGLRIAFNDGTGMFTEDSTVPRPVGFPIGTDTNLTSLDVDGDGLMDLVVWSPFHHMTICLNQGDGTMASHTAMSFSQWWLPRFGDVDGDGDLDVALFARTIPLVHAPPLFYLNDGTGHFSFAALNAPTHTEASVGEFGDVDGDGDQDLVIGLDNPIPSSTQPGKFVVWQLWLNDGQGNFTEAPESSMPVVADPLVTGSGEALFDLGDVDADGDVDILVLNAPIPGGGRSWVLWNLERHLYAPKVVRQDPVAGPVYDIQMFAQPGNVVALIAGFGRAHFHLPGRGILAFDPTLSMVTPTMLVPTSGEITVTFPVPTDPVFNGIGVHWQALDIDPLVVNEWKLMAGYSWDSIL